MNHGEESKIFLFKNNFVSTTRLTGRFSSAYYISDKPYILRSDLITFGNIPTKEVIFLLTYVFSANCTYTIKYFITSVRKPTLQLNDKDHRKVST